MKKTNVGWSLTHWYEKVAYVVGVIVSIIYVAAFCLGVVAGLLE